MPSGVGHRLLQAHHPWLLKGKTFTREREYQANKAPGNTFAQASSIFGAMNPHDSNFPIPPITEVPDYVWSRRYSAPKDTARRISHPNAEAALKAAKKACRRYPGRWYGQLHLQGPVDVDSFNINICTTRKQTPSLQSTAEKRDLLTLFCT